MIVLSLVLNSFKNDNRVLRAAKACCEMGGKVYVFALHESELKEEEDIESIRIKRFKLITRFWSKKYFIQFIKYFEVIFRMVKEGKKIKPDVVHANDLNTIVIGYIISRMAKCKLIYDSHELSTDRSEKRFPSWFYKITFMMEKYFAKKANAVVTVSKSIAEIMANNLEINPPYVIRNLPEPYKHSSKKIIKPLRHSLNLSDDIPIILYQGCVNPDRGLETLVKAFTIVKNKDAVLVFLGDGQLKDSLMSFVADNMSRKKVFFHPFVPPEELLNWTSDATIGVHPMEDICLNHRYALPNKLFEYIQAGLPVIVSDLPEMKKVVKEYEVGEVFPNGDYAKLAEKIDEILANMNLLKAYHTAALDAAEELNWDQEKKKLKTIYKGLLEN